MSQQKLAKILAVLFPVFVFTFLAPSFESKDKTVGFVLGASTANADTDTGLDVNRDLILPKLPAVFQSGYAAAPTLQAKSVLVYDSGSGAILYSKNIDDKLPIASLTKLMTAVVAEEDPDFSNPITITAEDHLAVSPYLGIATGEQVRPIDLVKAMLIGSANDAAYIIANHFPNHAAFVDKMNAKAAQLGMTNTHYSNPMGFDSDQNYSTAADLQKLVNYALLKLPYDQIWQQQDSYSFKTLNGTAYSIRNSNKLVFNHENIKSIKTGLTPEALGNMIVEAQNPKGDSVIAIVLGTSDRDDNTLSIINYIFDNFSWK